LVGPKEFSAKFQISDTYGNATFEVDLSRKTVKKILDVEKPNGLTLDPSGNLYIITFTEPGRISFVSDDISGGDGIASGYEYGKVVLIGSDGKY
jgi:sugar lactone lactonase YvrE